MMASDTSAKSASGGGTFSTLVLLVVLGVAVLLGLQVHHNSQILQQNTLVLETVARHAASMAAAVAASSAALANATAAASSAAALAASSATEATGAASKAAAAIGTTVAASAAALANATAAASAAAAHAATASSAVANTASAVADAAKAAAEATASARSTQALPAVAAAAAPVAAPVLGACTGGCGGFFLPPKTRYDIPGILQERGYTTAIELGVQRGGYALHTLTHWRACTKYYLVDAWKHQTNYHDHANAPQSEQDRIYDEAKANLKSFESKTVFLRHYTSEAVKIIPGEVDFVYVDARHDYCGVLEDLELYWPKIRSGGLMAGHDFLDAPSVRSINGQDWSKCLNGTIHNGSVKGAVDDFFRKRQLPVHVTYYDSPWGSWLVVKP